MGTPESQLTGRECECVYFEAGGGTCYLPHINHMEWFLSHRKRKAYIHCRRSWVVSILVILSRGKYLEVIMMFDLC